jgi:hypothetical protein
MWAAAALTDRLVDQKPAGPIDQPISRTFRAA